MSNGSASLTTREFLGEAVRTAAAEVEETAAAALADEPDGVHQHRVRVRRLRSVLAGFRDRLDRETADGMRARLAALAATPEAAARRKALAGLGAASVTGDPDEKAAPFIAAVLAAQARRV